MWKAAIASSALALVLTGCAGDTAPATSNTPSVAATDTGTPSGPAPAPTETETEEPADPNLVGINELAVGDSGPQQAGDYLEVDAVYFQAIDMGHGTMAMPPAMAVLTKA